MCRNSDSRLWNQGASSHVRKRSVDSNLHRPVHLVAASTLCLALIISGCVSDDIDEQGSLASYQRFLARRGPQSRVDPEGQDPSEPLGLLKPTAYPERPVQAIEVTKDPDTGEEIAELTIEQAIERALANSPEITVISFDPEIAKQELTKEAAEFDVTAFGRVNYEENDNPVNSIFEPGQSNTRALESGIKQRIPTGSEWSLSYALTRSWDDLVGRTLPTRYEPILAFELRQPLLRDGWREVNLAGVNIARLNHQVALLGFRQKAEEISTQVIAAYWQLDQAYRGLEIQERLLERTLETLEKVKGRSEIDATDAQIKQAEAYVKARKAGLLEAEKRVMDAQDVLVRFMADPQINMVSELKIAPMTVPQRTADDLQQLTKPEHILSVATQKNPAIQQAKVAVAIANINVRVAENQRMPRLDLIASTRTQTLAQDRIDAQKEFDTLDYFGYTVGLSLEYPLGNRQRTAEVLRRRFERKKAVSTLQSTADQVATRVKERARKVQTNLAQIEVQEQAVEAARAQLEAVEESEPIRERLTPEFLLVKLQSQETLAQAQRAEARAVAEFNTSVAQLAQATGTVLELHQVGAPLSSVLSADTPPDEGDESGQ